MNRYPWIIGALLGLLTFTSCTKYLDKSPNSDLNIEVDNEEKIAELLTGAYPTASYIPFLEPRTDNVGFRPYGEQNRLNEAMYFWEDYDQEDLDTPLNYWNACYRGIAQVNIALELLTKYPKTERIKALYGEAFLLRAYLHFMLVNIWAEPYRGADDLHPGIPYLKSPEKHAMVDYDRATVAKVYEEIEADLKLGITLVNDRFYRHPKFHFNKKAAYAFASRFYLHKGEWQKVVDYANYVLGGDPKRELRHWTEYQKQYEFARPQLFKSYASALEPANLLLSTTESRWARELPRVQYGPTKESVEAIFDKKGIENGGNFKRLNQSSSYLFTPSPLPLKVGRYISKFDEVRSNLDSGLKPRGLYVTNVLFTTDEVLLNRMEALAMLGGYNKAIDDLQEYTRGKFGFTPYVERSIYLTTNPQNYQVYSPYYPLTIKQLAFVKLVLDFRQKEFYQEGLRWLDIRRFHLSVARDSKSKYYFPLEKDDPRKLLQIPNEAIKRGLQPNPRERKELDRK